MAVVWLWGGGASDSGFRVSTKLDTSANLVRLAVSIHPGLTDPVYSDAVTPSAQNVAKFSITGLAPDTQYYYGVEIDGALDWEYQGQIRTHPVLGMPADFTIAAASCAGTGSTSAIEGDPLVPSRVSNHGVFSTILSHAPLEWVHMGDMHYYDIGSGVHVANHDLATFRRAYDDVMAQSRQHALNRGVATRYVYDDHDYGPNDSDRTAPGRDNVTRVYREVVPHGPLPTTDSTDGIYHGWRIGRVQFVAFDSRADRDPNSITQGLAKTMLGSSQRAWFEQILATSPAKAMVIVSPTVWHEPGRADGWHSFQDERQWVIDRLAQYGWTSRVVIISGDVHSLAIDTGGNSPGGIPVFQFASLDANHGTNPQTHYDTGPSRPGRGQYGLLRCRDLGSEIHITGTCMVMGTEWRSHTHVVEVDRDPDPGPDPEDPDIIPAPVPVREQSSVMWLAHDATTGKIIAELPEVTGPTGRLIGAYWAGGLRVAAPLSGPAAIGDVLWQATTPGRTMLSQIVNNRPSWVGLVTSRVGGTEPEINVGTVTPDGYLDRRRVRDHNLRQVDQARIAELLIRDAGPIPEVGAGLPILIDAPHSGVPRDRDYEHTSRKTVYACLRELMGVRGGPEWMIDAEWSDSTQTAISLIARVRNRIGVTSGALFENSPASVFDGVGESDATYELTEDYTDSRGANYVIAYSSGEGDDQPASQPAIATWALANGWPIFESHWQPSTSITDEATLDSHAAARLERMAYGAQILKITARWDAAPRLHLDWGLGDDIRWNLYGHRHPNGFEGTGRAIGYELDAEAGTVSPILYVPSEEPIDE